MTDEEPLEPTTEWVREHMRRYVATDGADGMEWRGVPTLLLTMRGRRSGRLRRTPLIFGRDAEERPVIVASYGGRPKHPEWYLNLQANPEVTIQIGGEVSRARARTAEGEERERLWRMMAARFPSYDEYQAKTERRIPVVVLEPLPA
jgi:deazaflavin-dependent oxidoreductase (nitroreductase family)